MEITTDNLEAFLERNRISKLDWEKSGLSTSELTCIAKDHVKNIAHLNESAEFLARVLLKCNQVHSVRWRIKTPEHLLEKIIRKRALGSEKYLKINEHNYSEIVTDLVGVRVLHLFKHEWRDIHSYILSNWQPLETVKAYIREGDEGGIVDSYKENGCDVEPHVAGYRSIHYIISTQPTLKNVVSEIQVRTIFEEGWSEIDHRVRYPNFSENKLIAYFLTIFNRMAGSADEMGTFVKDLTAEISLQELRYRDAQEKHDAHLSKIESLALALSQEKKQNKAKENSLEKLNQEIKELRMSTSVSGLYANSHITALAGIDLDAIRGSLPSLDLDLDAIQSSSALAGLDIDAIRDSSALAGLDSDAIRSSSALENFDLDALGGSSVIAAPDSSVERHRRTSKKKGSGGQADDDDN